MDHKAIEVLSPRKYARSEGDGIKLDPRYSPDRAHSEGSKSHSLSDSAGSLLHFKLDPEENHSDKHYEEAHTHYIKHHHEANDEHHPKTEEAHKI